uniref:Zinc finger transcription factor n=1 Tax=Diospyros kaki TaxID=35925 RepID=A0A5Q2WVU3_DIOKA|nr:zinc finger transcription factor [Diospyros kaki]
MNNPDDHYSATTTRPPISPSPAQEIVPSFGTQSAAGDIFRTPNNPHQKPRKKRTKLMRIENPPSIGASSSSSADGVAAKSKSGKKPDPDAPKITRPCSECGKTFWSWKALFGHMRCHPERQWRGINPPPNFRRPSPTANAEAGMTTDEDHDVAACLLMLANAPRALDSLDRATTSTDRGPLESGTTIRDAVTDGCGGGGAEADATGPSGASFRFECSSCKRVFGSHQALGGHRASHKNVKGCFASARSDSEEIDHRGEEDEEKMMMVLGHKCSICWRIFSSGQALGGHKRRHWEKCGDDRQPPPAAACATSRQSCGLDLNLPAPVDKDDGDLSSSYSSGGVSLDLRLGL